MFVMLSTNLEWRQFKCAMHGTCWGKIEFVLHLSLLGCLRWVLATGWQRPMGCLIIIGRFPQKSPEIWMRDARHLLETIWVCIRVIAFKIGFGLDLSRLGCLCWVLATGWRRPIGCLIFVGHLPQKSPEISGSFAERDLQPKVTHASLPPCMRCPAPSRQKCVLFLIYLRLARWNVFISL